MDLRGKTVVVAGRFRTESVAKLRMRLQGAGASVVDEVPRTGGRIADPAVGPAAALVVADEDRLDSPDDLDAVLAWTVDRRFSWPVRWGGLDVVASVEAASALLRLA
ncbi:hypothetical protein ACTMTI_16595 [Nonomuraea sp. H19]|uniref:hypothetical protein n=1 Tax=Nonomuraea sp. H19 TaxID=3452206 RepID=UPI003F8A6610